MFVFQISPGVQYVNSAQQLNMDTQVIITTNQFLSPINPIGY